MELRDHIVRRAFTPNGTIARTTVEQHAGVDRGAVVRDTNPVALAFFRAIHDKGCGCSYCK
jgi:hypothetical protein